MRKITALIFLIIGFTVFAQDTKRILLKDELLEISPKLQDSIEVFAITYLSDGLKVNGFMVCPKAKGVYPAVIYNRGGNRDFGALTKPYVAGQLGKLAKKGYVVIASQYRGNGGSEGTEEFGGGDVNDVLNLIDVFKEVSKADTTRIGMYGWSRGGMMTYRALTKTNRIKAAVVGGGLSDMTASLERPEMERVYSELIPNYKENKVQALQERSAIYWVDNFPKNVPILMLHGNSDWRVKPDQPLKLALEFEKYRIPYRLIMFEGCDHGITEKQNEVDNEVLNWFNRYLKNNEPLPDMKYHGR